MLKKTLFTAVIIGAVASAQAVTIATHQDPALNGTTPLFFASAGAVSGSWTGTGLTLTVPVTAQTFNNVKMDMASVTRVGNTLGAGTVKFYTSDINNPIFRVDFAAGSIFEPFGLGASFASSQGVNFSGSAVSALTFTNKQFAFSFANPVSSQNGNSYTASFTSSADVVPEPASMAILGLGVASLARRKRK
ncbi:MAG: PEP-CTERM sorting domain-containing protein [Fimbriimonadaceae bacterium]